MGMLMMMTEMIIIWLVIVPAGQMERKILLMIVTLPTPMTSSSYGCIPSCFFITASFIYFFYFFYSFFICFFLYLFFLFANDNDVLLLTWMQSNLWSSSLQCIVLLQNYRCCWITNRCFDLKWPPNQSSRPSS